MSSIATRLRLCALLLAALVISGCDASDDQTDPTNPSNLTGLWLMTQEFEDYDGGTTYDVRNRGLHLDVASNLNVTLEQHYAAPANCFERNPESVSIRLQHIAEDRYRLIETYGTDTESTNVTIALTASTMRMTFGGGDYLEFERRNQRPSNCSFSLLGEYTLDQVNGSSLPHGITINGQVHRIQHGDAWMEFGRGFDMYLFQELYDSQGNYLLSNYVDVWGAFRVTSASGAFAYEEREGSDMPSGLVVTGEPVSGGVRMTLRHPELNNQELQLRFRRDGSGTARPDRERSGATHPLRSTLRADRTAAE